MSTEIVRKPANGTVNIPSDPVALGQVLAASGFFQDSRSAAQAAVKVMAGQELGFGPVASMTGVYIVKGRVTLSANLMAAAIKRHPAYNYRVKQHTTETCVIDFIESGEVIGTSEFTIEDARTAGLAGGENYRKFAKNMLFARALSNGAKWYCPDVFGGGPIYTPDELGAEVDGETGEVVDAPAVEPAPPEIAPAVETVTATAPEDKPLTKTQLKQLVGLLIDYERKGRDLDMLAMKIVHSGLDEEFTDFNEAFAQLTRAQGKQVYEWMTAELESSS